jgi:hypothetical protein
MKRRNKKGQFFLIATLVVVSILITLATFMNYSRTENYTNLNEIKEELDTEGIYVLDYGVYNEKDMKELLRTFAINFSEYIGENVDLYFIYGEESDLEGIEYEDGVISNLVVSESGGNAEIDIKGETYTFDINTGKSFYYVLSQEINGEKYITVS